MKTADKRLWNAVENDSMNEIRRLVEEEGANPTPSMLSFACIKNRLATLRYFVEERDANLTISNAGGQTLLHIACAVGSLKTVEYLVGTGIFDIDAKDEKLARTPLHDVCACCHSPDVALYLIEQGANVNARDSQGLNALSVVLETMDLLPCYDSSGNLMHLARLLIPRTQLGREIFRYDFWTRICLPWDIKELLITTYTMQNPDVPNEYCQHFPMHTVFRVPLESEGVLLEAICHYRNHTSSRSFDCDGRLPIHLALEAGSICNTAVTPRVIRELLEIEPRSAFVRDVKTGFFPFEAAAPLLVTGSSERNKEKVERQLLNLIYLLFRCNPDRRGVGHGYSDYNILVS